MIGGAEVRNNARIMKIPAGAPDFNHWFLEALPDRISGMSPIIKR